MPLSNCFWSRDWHDPHTRSGPCRVYSVQGCWAGDGDVTDPIWHLIGQFDHITIGQ